MGTQPGDKHPLQKLMDNPWLLLALGIVIPFVSYTAWGVWEIFHIPVDTLP